MMHLLLVLYELQLHLIIRFPDYRKNASWVI